MKNLDWGIALILVGLIMAGSLVFYAIHKNFELEHMYIQSGYEQCTIPGVSHLIWKKSCTN